MRFFSICRLLLQERWMGHAGRLAISVHCKTCSNIAWNHRRCVYFISFDITTYHVIRNVCICARVQACPILVLCIPSASTPLFYFPYSLFATLTTTTVTTHITPLYAQTTPENTTNLKPLAQGPTAPTNPTLARTTPICASPCSTQSTTRVHART